MSQEYLQAAKAYYVANEQRGFISAAEEITGLWVATDEETVVDEARALVDHYFPAVQRGHVVCVSFGQNNGPETDGPAQNRFGQVRII